MKPRTVTRRALLGTGAAAALLQALPAVAQSPAKPLVLNDASRLSATPVARHWRPARVTGDAWPDALRAELKAAAAEGRPVALGAARHSMGGQVLFAFVTSLNYIPGLTDAEGRTFGLFALDVFDDALHGASGLWAALAAWWSTRATVTYFRWFGTLYCLDGLLGLATGSGYLDLGIFLHGVLDLSFVVRVLMNLPHIAIGGFAAFTGFVLARRWARPAGARG